MCSILLEAYDDGFFPYYFKACKGSTYIVGVEVEDFRDVRKVVVGLVKVDERNTLRVIRDISMSMSGDIILLDGVIYAGFDVVDPWELYNSTGKGVIVIQLHPLNLESIKKALREHFVDWSERFSVIENVYNKMIRVETPWRVIEVYSVGVDFNTMATILKRSCLYSPIPEPLRIADKIASTLSRLHLNQLYYQI